MALLRCDVLGVSLPLFPPSRYAPLRFPYLLQRGVFIGSVYTAAAAVQSAAVLRGSSARWCPGFGPSTRRQLHAQ